MLDTVVAMRCRRTLIAVAAMGVIASACANGTTAHPTAASTSSTVHRPATRPVAARPIAGTSWPGAGGFVGPERVVPVGTVVTGFRQFGHGPDLVLLEGEQMTMSEWPLSLLRDLADHYRVTIFDWRGVDRSTDDARAPYTIEQLADDTARLIDALALHAPDVYGLSTGGEVGLALVVRHPDHVHKLVVSGATPGGRDTVPTPAAIERQFEDPATSPMTLLGFLFPSGDDRDRDAYLTELMRVPQTLASDAVARRQLQMEARFAAGPGLGPALRTVTTPVLVLNGERDQLVPVANARRIATMIPGAQLHVFPDAGHMLIFQDRAEFVAWLQAFLH